MYFFVMPDTIWDNIGWDHPCRCWDLWYLAEARAVPVEPTDMESRETVEAPSGTVAEMQESTKTENTAKTEDSTNANSLSPKQDDAAAETKDDEKPTPPKEIPMPTGPSTR